MLKSLFRNANAAILIVLVCWSPAARAVELIDPASAAVTAVHPGSRKADDGGHLQTHRAWFDDADWTPLYREDFDSAYEAVDGQTFGQSGWLTYQLLNDGAITVENGYAQLNAPDFWNAGLIRSTSILPPEYKIRTKIGHINYDLTNYEQEDYDDPDFNTHQGYYENGMYFLTVTNDTCSGDQCAEEWWHYHRKMVIDVDNHLNYGDTTHTFHPVFMVYMAPETNSGGNLLRTWTGAEWDSSAWNWNVAYTYEYDTWYYAELEKRNDSITLRLYDETKDIIEETTPVPLERVFAMDDSTEFLYVGEPHTDDYEGDVRIDEITLLVPYEHCCTGQSVGNIDGSTDDMVTMGDLTVMIDHLFISLNPLACVEEGNIDLSTNHTVTMGDLTVLIDHLFITLAPLPPCPFYEGE